MRQKVQAEARRQKLTAKVAGRSQLTAAKVTLRQPQPSGARPDQRRERTALHHPDVQRSVSDALRHRQPEPEPEPEPEPPAFQVIQTPVEGVADGMVGAFASQLTGGSGKLASADHSKVSARIRAGGKAKAKKKSAGAARSRNGFYDSSDSSDSDSEPASKVAASQEPKPAAAAKRKATTATKPTAASNKWTNPAPKKVPEKRQAVAPPPPQKLVVTEQMVAEKMAEFDADGNGVLDTEEVAALLEAMADLTTAARNASPERSRSPETRGRDPAAAAAVGGAVRVVTAAEVAE